jgi:predicted glycosyltransferase
MVDIWLDAVTPKDSLLIYALLPALKEKGYDTIITAKRQTQTTDVLELLGIPYTCVGKYGETLREKLVEEQKRTLEFVKLFDKVGLPKVLWTHGDVSAIRTAFGLQIPIVYSNDTPHAVHVARLVCPLVDWLIAPICFGKSWSKFGIPKYKILLYDGVEEVAWLTKPIAKKPDFLEALSGKDNVILFRNVEYKASYCKDVKVDVWQLVEELSKIATVIYLPRYEEEKEKLKNFGNVLVPDKPLLTFQILPFVDLVVGSGGTICRESALLGIPTINFHFWDAVAKYLHRKNFPIYFSTRIKEILKLSHAFLRKTNEHKVNTRRIFEKLESPVPITNCYLEKYCHRK